MGKKKSLFKKTLKRFLKKHPTLLTGIATVSAGIAIADALGIAKKILQPEDDKNTALHEELEKKQNEKRFIG